MDSFYEIKDGMTRQHKEFLLSLKNVYDGSIKDYKRQENEAKSKVDFENEKLRNILEKQKQAERSIEKIAEEAVLASGAILRLADKKKEVDNLIIASNESDRKRKEMAALEVKAFEYLKATEKNRQDEREKELNIKKQDIASIAKMNEESLRLFENERQRISRETAYLEKLKQDTEKAQKNLSDVIDENKLLLDKIRFEAEKNEALRTKNNEQGGILDNRLKGVETRERGAREIEGKSDNRVLQLDLREAELDKRESRVKALIDIHNLKGKV